MTTDCADPEFLAVAALPHHGRFLGHCRDAPEAYRPLVRVILAGVGRGGPPPAPTASRAPAPALPTRREARWAAGCPYRERCGCRAPRCREPDRGPRFGSPDGTDYRATVYDCARCLAAYDRGLPSPTESRS